MTVPAATRKSGSYVGDGSNKNFPYTFKVDSASELKVTLTVIATGVETTVDPSLYTVSGIGEETGGTVVYPSSGSAISSAYSVTISGNETISQLTDITNAGDFYPSVHEAVFDKLTRIAQQQQEELSRCFKSTISSSYSSPDEYLASLSEYVTSASASAAAADASADAAEGAAASVSALNIAVDVFSGDSSNKSFTLSRDPVSINNVEVFISGVYQQKANYSLAGSVLTFVTAPPSGTNNIEIRSGSFLLVGTVSDAAITADKLADGSITTAKLADNAVTSSKLSMTGVALPNGSTATTQAVGDNSTKLSTTAYADRAGGAGMAFSVVTGSRAFGTTYTNTTGGTIYLLISSVQVAGGYFRFVVGGVTLSNAAPSSVSEICTYTSVVPAGATYSIASNMTLNYWAECRL